MPMKILSAVTCALLLGGTIYLGTIVHAQQVSERFNGTSLGSGGVDAAACARLASLTLPNATVTSAQAVSAGQFAPPEGSKEAFADLPAFCRVAMTLTPSRDSDIKAEAWLPLAGWNGKFQQVGNGGWGGSIQYGALADALRRGYAAASTDTGHLGGSASFALGHPEKLIDFGYRAVHETALKSKTTIAALYGIGQRLSYFTGCSGGGRQAFMEAQRFPEDFEGIVAGDPGYDRTGESFQLVATAQAALKDPASRIPPEKLAVLHQAALDACDARDGLKDGIIDDPRLCKFDPAVTQCKGADGPGCLTAPQVEAAKKIYAPLNDPKTGKELYPGFEPGSELLWTGTAGGPRPLAVADDLFKYVVFKDANWDFRTLDLSQHLAMAMKIDNGVLSATSPNLKTFVGRGGKLIIYHGWGDQNVAPRFSIEYYQKVESVLGTSQVENSVRLYMVPGMGHCGGGEGPNVFDTLTPLEQWKEHGTAPKEIVASLITKGTVVRTRPLCPYPQVAQYKGSGSIDLAENFACRMP
jgi:feruloyl esterase